MTSGNVNKKKSTNSKHRGLQGYVPKAPRPIQGRPPPTLESLTSTDKLPRDHNQGPLTQYPFSSRTEQSPSSTSSILGPDGWLTPIERQCRMNLGLCMCCGQSSYLARSCPKQAYQSSGLIKVCTSYINQSVDSLELSKNNLAVTSHPRESTA